MMEEQGELRAECDAAAASLVYLEKRFDWKKWLSNAGYLGDVSGCEKRSRVTGEMVFEAACEIVNWLFQASELREYSMKMFCVKDVGALCAGLLLLFVRLSVKWERARKFSKVVLKHLVRKVCATWYDIAKFLRLCPTERFTDVYCRSMLFGFFTELGGGLGNDTFAEVVNRVLLDGTHFYGFVCVWSWQLLQGIVGDRVLERDEDILAEAKKYDAKETLDACLKMAAISLASTKEQAASDVKNLDKSKFFGHVFSSWILLMRGLDAIEDDLEVFRRSMGDDDLSCPEFNKDDYNSRVPEDWEPRIQNLCQSIHDDPQFGAIFAAKELTIDDLPSCVVGPVVDCVHNEQIGFFMMIGVVGYAYASLFCLQCDLPETVCLQCTRTIVSYFWEFLGFIRNGIEINQAIDEYSMSIQQFRKERQLSWNDICLEWVYGVFIELHTIGDLVILWSVIIDACLKIDFNKAQKKAESPRSGKLGLKKKRKNPNDDEQTAVLLVSRLCIAHVMDFQPELANKSVSSNSEIFRQYKKWDLKNIIRMYQTLMQIEKVDVREPTFVRNAKEEKWVFNMDSSESVIVQQTRSWLKAVGIDSDVDSIQTAYNEYSSVVKSAKGNMPSWFVKLYCYAKDVVDEFLPQTQWETMYSHPFLVTTAQIFKVFWNKGDSAIKTTIVSREERKQGVIRLVVAVFLSMRQYIEEIALDHSKPFKESLSEALAYKFVFGLLTKIGMGYTEKFVTTVMHDFATPQGVKGPMFEVLDSVFWNFFTINHELKSIQTIWTAIFSEEADVIYSIIMMSLAHIAFIVEHHQDQLDTLAISPCIQENASFFFDTQRVQEFFGEYKSLPCPTKKEEAKLFISKILELKRYSHRVIAWLLHFGVIENFNWTHRRSIMYKIQQDYLDMIEEYEQDPHTRAVLEKMFIGNPDIHERKESEQIEKDVRRMMGYDQETLLQLELIENKDIHMLMYKGSGISGEERAQKDTWGRALQSFWERDKRRISRILHLCCLLDKGKFGYWQGMSRPATILYVTAQRAVTCFDLDDTGAEAIAFYLLRAFLALMKTVIVQIGEMGFYQKIQRRMEKLGTDDIPPMTTVSAHTTQMIESAFLDTYRYNIPSVLNIWDSLFAVDDATKHARDLCAVHLAALVKHGCGQLMGDAEFTNHGCVIVRLIKEARDIKKS